MLPMTDPALNVTHQNTGERALSLGGGAAAACT
jgi:hypothetical protein